MSKTIYEEEINGRTPEKIKRWVDSRVTCNTCPKEHEVGCEYGERTEDCQMCIDTIAYIERLESERDVALAKVPKWISIEERLPQYSARYLVCHYRGPFAPYVMQVSYYDTNKKEWHGASACSILRGVTHWMEKIELPREIV